VVKDPEGPDALWSSKVWDSEEAWKASLELSAVASIDKVLPLIATSGEPTVTEPVALLP
jgi:hypothetical protein